MAGVLGMFVQPSLATDTASIVGSGKGKALQAIQSPKEAKATQDIINYRGTDVPEVSLKNDNLLETARDRAQNDPNAQIVKDAFIKRNEVGLSKDDKMFRKADEVMKHPEKHVDWISGKYEDCDNAKGNEVFAKEEQVCDEFNDVQYQGSQGKGYKYQCVKQKESIKTRCDQNLLVKFEEYEEGCKAIVFNSWRLKNTNVTVGNDEVVIEHQFPRESRGSAYSDNIVSVKFDVNDLEGVKELYIESLSFPFYPTENSELLRIEMNQKIVTDYVGRKESEAHIDLKPYIKQGTNWISFKMQLNFYKEKTLGIRIKYKKLCLKEKEQWHEVCRPVGGVS